MSWKKGFTTHNLLLREVHADTNIIWRSRLNGQTLDSHNLSKLSLVIYDTRKWGIQCKSSDCLLTENGEALTLFREEIMEDSSLTIWFDSSLSTLFYNWPYGPYTEFEIPIGDLLWRETCGWRCYILSPSRVAIKRKTLFYIHEARKLDDQLKNVNYLPE